MQKRYMIRIDLSRTQGISVAEMIGRICDAGFQFDEDFGQVPLNKTGDSVLIRGLANEDEIRELEKKEPISVFGDGEATIFK